MGCVSSATGVETQAQRAKFDLLQPRNSRSGARAASATFHDGKGYAMDCLRHDQSPHQRRRPRGARCTARLLRDRIVAMGARPAHAAARVARSHPGRAADRRPLRGGGKARESGAGESVRAARRMAHAGAVPRRGTPDAYEAKIAVDSVLVGGGQPKRLYITFFAPHGNRIPTVGENAIWIAHQRQLWRFAQATVYGAPYDIGLALDSDDDIRPVGEWSLLRTVALKLQLSHVW